VSTPVQISLTRMCAPLIVWAVHFVTVYSLQGIACAQQVWRTRIAGMESVTWALWAVTAAALLLIAYEGLRAKRIHRAWRAHAEDGRAAPDRQRFIALLSLLVAIVAAVGVTFTVVPVALLPTCA